MLRQLLRTTAAAAALTLAAAAPAAAQVNGALIADPYTGQYLTGTVTLLTSGSWGDPYQVKWEVQQDAEQTDLLRYTYTFLGAGYTAPSISHTIIQLTSGCTVACASGAEYNGQEGSVEGGAQIGTQTSTGNGNSWDQALGWSFYGVKFDQSVAGTVTTLSFLSTQLPVWGNIYLKGGRDSYAYNSGLTGEGTDFIARPDGQTFGGGGGGSVVPEPSTYLLLGSGLLGLAGIARRRRTNG